MEFNLHARHACAVCASAAAHFAAVALCIAIAIPATAQAAEEAKPAAAAAKTGKATTKYQVIFHVSIDDPRIWNQALNNMAQVQKVLGKDNVEVELAVNGYGIGMLKMESEVGDRVNQAVEHGIKVVACEQTMRGFKLTKDDMLKSIGYVPGGVIEVMKKQKAGWAYLKP